MWGPKGSGGLGVVIWGSRGGGGKCLGGDLRGSKRWLGEVSRGCVG